MPKQLLQDSSKLVQRVLMFDPKRYQSIFAIPKIIKSLTLLHETRMSNAIKKLLIVSLESRPHDITIINNTHIHNYITCEAHDSPLQAHNYFRNNKKKTLHAEIRFKYCKLAQ